MAGRHKWDDIRREASPAAEAAAQRNIEAMERRYAATLRELRRARALTQEQLAEQMGISQSEISRASIRPTCISRPFDASSPRWAAPWRSP